MDAVEIGRKLAERISDSGHDWPGPPLNENPIWLRKVAAQAVAILREDPVLYVGHNVQKGPYAHREPTYEGQVIIATADQLLYSTILTTEVTTFLYGLNEVRALRVMDVADFSGRGATWPADIRFVANIRELQLSFPISPDPTDTQKSEAYALLHHLNAALRSPSRR